MSAIISLGKFERVELTDAWPTEDGNFTPWLAEQSNIKLLGDAIGMELEVEAIEHPVGSFRADILARAVAENDHRVIIENQFGSTDHRHLGQNLTYLAGIKGAKTIVWIAEAIQPEHRAAVDWLNTNTADEFSFFAIEVELWQIDKSPPAPRFNVIASPNDWTRGLPPDGPVGELGQLRIAYWTSFAKYLKEKGSTFTISRPRPYSGTSFPIGRGGFYIYTVISTEKWVRVELYISNDPDKVAFGALRHEKEAIEHDFGEPLEWGELPGKKASRIALSRHGVNPTDETQREDIHAWMLSKMEQFRKAFAARVKLLSLASVGEPSEEDEPGT